MARLALLSLLLLISAACGGNQASGGAVYPATSRSSGPVLVVENGTGNAYEVFVMFTGVDRGRTLGTVGPLRNTPLPLAELPRNGSVRFRARPIGAPTIEQYSEYDRDVVSDRVELIGGRQVTWSLRPGGPSQVTSVIKPR